MYTVSSMKLLNYPQNMLCLEKLNVYCDELLFFLVEYVMWVSLGVVYHQLYDQWTNSLATGINQRAERVRTKEQTVHMKLFILFCCRR